MHKIFFIFSILYNTIGTKPGPLYTDSTYWVDQNEHKIGSGEKRNIGYEVASRLQHRNQDGCKKFKISSSTVKHKIGNIQMLYLDEIGGSPRTPPRNGSKIEAAEAKYGFDGRQQGIVNALHTPVTASRRSVKILEMLPKDESYIDHEDEHITEVPMTPGFTPQKSKTNRKYQKGSISKSIHTTPKLTRSSEIASPSLLRTSRNRTKRYSFTKKIRPISLGLQLSLAQEELSSDEATESKDSNQIRIYPEDIESEKQVSTPKGKIIDDRLVKEWHEKSLNNEFSSDEDLLDYENMMFSNDILGNKPSKTNKEQISNPFTSAPFNLNIKTNKPTSPVVDYSTHTEYFNNKTGERVVRELTEDEKRIKPKKLSFKFATEENDRFNEPHQPSIVDSGNREASVGNKFLLNNLNRFMIDSKPKNSLGFEIFKDNEN